MELRELAKLLDRAVEADRAIEVLHLPGDDIFDLTDESVICELFPRFPGHIAARAAATASGRSWKAFYEEQYGLDIKDVGLFEDLATRMRRAHRVPAALTAFFDEIRDAALGELADR